MRLREYTSADCRETAELFRETVHTVNAGDYTEPQRNAWTDCLTDLTAWNQSFLEHKTLVAEEDGLIAGFGDITDGGYLDRLYVHKDFQRRGIASAICDALEKNACGGRIITHASITAKPFFLHRGYRIIRKQQVLRRGAALTNYVMEKQIGEEPLPF